MNIKYYHDFIGADDVVNRFEILQNTSTTPKLIKATNEPFSIEYIEVKKLEPVQGSQATLRLICEKKFPVYRSSYGRYARVYDQVLSRRSTILDRLSGF